MREEYMLEMMPLRPNAARICIIVPSGPAEGLTLIAGKGTFFEVPKGGRRYTDLSAVDEARVICVAVIRGKLAERVVLDGAEVLRGKGTIQLERPVTVKWRQFSFDPFGRRPSYTVL